MKIFLLGIFTCIFLQNAYTQDKKLESRTIETPKMQKQSRKGYINISGGYALPVGNFASKYSNNQKAGYVDPGFQVQINFGFSGDENGLSMMVLGGQHNFDSKAYQEDIASHINTFFPELDTDISSFEDYTFQYYGVFGGMKFHFPIYKSIEFETRLMGGAIKTDLPQWTTIKRDGPKLLFVEREAASYYSIAMNIGGHVKFKTSDRITLTLSTDYMLTTPEVSYMFRKPEDEEKLTGEYKEKMSIRTLSASLGVSYNLW